MTTILVTGATGYIGKEFVKTYYNKYNFILLVRNISNISFLEDLNCIIERYSNFMEIENIFKRYNISGVIHFAANVIVEHKEKDIQNLINSNITYGSFLLEFSKHYSVKWFINTGTFWQNYNSDNYNPVNLYAATKEAFKNMAKYYTETSDLIFTTIKLNDTFGENDKRYKIFNLWNKISKTGEILEMSAGEQIIDISYIEDVLSAYEILINHLNSDKKEEFKNKEFVVTNNEKISLKELSKVFEESTDSKLNIVWGGRPYRDREVMIPYNTGESVPNWKQKYTLKEAIRKTTGDD